MPASSGSPAATWGPSNSSMIAVARQCSRCGSSFTRSALSVPIRSIFSRVRASSLAIAFQPRSSSENALRLMCASSRSKPPSDAADDTWAPDCWSHPESMLRLTMSGICDQALSVTFGRICAV